MKRRFLFFSINNPVHWFVSILIFIAFYQAATTDRVDSTIRSDGRGYYAYLPALLIYNDATYQASMEAEKRNSPMISDQLYIYKDENGNFYNKYFPGVAVMQLPFFGMACFFSWILGAPIDGYSTIFYFFFFLGGLFYGLGGILLYTHCLKLLFPQENLLIEWLIPVFYCSTMLLFYSFDSLSFGHLYSFFLFGLFSFTVLHLKEKQSIKRLFLLGSILGLIVLIRPTNGLIILIIPFLLAEYQQLKQFIHRLFDRKGINVISGFLGFFLFLSVQFFIWKWQSGDWVKWSYNGEGFNFSHPQLFAGFFSFRIGLLIHTPLLILAILGVLSLLKKNLFQVLAWGIYFFINSWVILSWWCWDYESNFGVRPYTEHLFFLLIPVVHFVLNFPKWFVLFTLIVVTANGGIRYWESRSGFLSDQRFTRDNFIPSLKFWDSTNYGRWNFTRSVVPHGKLINSEVLLDDKSVKKLGQADIFSHTAEKLLESIRQNERLYYRVKMAKKQNETDFNGVFLVIDAFTKDQKKRYYKAVELFQDRQEGRDNWAHLEFEGQIYDNFQEYDLVKFYIWNQAGKSFVVKDVQIILDTYKN